MGCHPSHWLSYFSRWLKPSCFGCNRHGPFGGKNQSYRMLLMPLPAAFKRFFSLKHLGYPWSGSLERREGRRRAKRAAEGAELSCLNRLRNRGFERFVWDFLLRSPNIVSCTVAQLTSRLEIVLDDFSVSSTFIFDARSCRQGRFLKTSKRCCKPTRSAL